MKRKEKFTETNIGLGKSKIKIMPGGFESLFDRLKQDEKVKGI